MTTGVVVFMIAVAFSCALAASPPFNPAESNYDRVPQCMQPPQSGLCLAYIPSFYYNPATKKCQSFIYGGCKGNKNRFFSEMECMSVCGEKDQSSEEEPILPERPKESQTEEITNICSQPKQSGHCYAYFERFYFNGEKCEKFAYGGCDANQNNFETEEECNKACPSKIVKTQPIAEKLPEVIVIEPTKPKESKDICGQPKQPGLCYAYFERFYFNGEKCEKFVYGGCNANQNNFKTEEECNKTCPPKVVESKEN